MTAENEEPVAWQYRGPDAGQGALARTRPKLNHEHWYPLYAGPTGFVPPPIPPEPPERHCSVCGKLESESQWGMLIDIRVIAHDGEEGAADITQLLCETHLVDMQKKLIQLGFKDHRHGGVNFLEDPDCPGMEHMADCPTPTDEDDFEVTIQ